MRKLYPYAGRILTVLGIVHVLCSPLFYTRALQGIVSAGIINGVADLPDRGEVFWYIGFGLMFIVLGEIVHWIQRRTGAVPPFLGWGLLVISIAAVALMPLSPFWLIIPLALFDLGAARTMAKQPA